MAALTYFALLQISFLTVRKDDKPAALLYLLKKVIPSNQQTIVFASTRYLLPGVQ